MSNASHALSDPGTGKTMDLEAISVGGNTVHRSRIILASPSDELGLAAVATSQAGTEMGLLVRVAGAVTTNVDVTDDAGRALGEVSVTGTADTSAASGAYVDGWDATQGSTADASSANTVIGRLKKIAELLASPVTVSVGHQAPGTYTGDFTSATAGATQDATAAPVSKFSLQVTADGTMTAWTVVVETSNDGSDFTTSILTHNATLGSMVFVADKPALYWRVHCTTFTPNTATKVTASVVAMP